MINVSCTFATYVINRTLVRLQRDRFRSGWNSTKFKSKKFDKNEQYMQEYLYSHFESEGHNGFLDDVSVSLIDKTKCSNLTKRQDKTGLWHYSDINAGPCTQEFIVILVEGFLPLTSIAEGSVWGAVGFLDTFWLLLRFVIYLIKNIHSSLSKVFSRWTSVSYRNNASV